MIAPFQILGVAHFQRYMEPCGAPSAGWGDLHNIDLTVMPPGAPVASAVINLALQEKCSQSYCIDLPGAKKLGKASGIPKRTRISAAQYHGRMPKKRPRQWAKRKERSTWGDARASFIPLMNQAEKLVNEQSTRDARPIVPYGIAVDV